MTVLIPSLAEEPNGEPMPALLIARFPGDPGHLRAAYDRAHQLLMTQHGPPTGELRHHCATDDNALYLVGVWESEAHINARFANPGFTQLLRSVGFPSPSDAELTILQLHVAEPPLQIAGRHIAP
jgi:hypothetical protein